MSHAVEFGGVDEHPVATQGRWGTPLDSDASIDIDDPSGDDRPLGSTHPTRDGQTTGSKVMLGQTGEGGVETPIADRGGFAHAEGNPNGRLRCSKTIAEPDECPERPLLTIGPAFEVPSNGTSSRRGRRCPGGQDSQLVASSADEPVQGAHRRVAHRPFDLRHPGLGGAGEPRQGML
jgi:hypothetical protein